MRCELSEIKNLLLSKYNRDEGDEPKEESKKSKPGKSRFGRCKKCVADNKLRCFHCWTCGQDDHKKGADECQGN